MAKLASEIWRDYAIANVPASGRYEPPKVDVRAWGASVESQLATFESADEVIKGTWAALAAVTGTRTGQRGEVFGPDASTHTDPVVGGTVANEGIYSWSTSPAGWQRLGARPELDEQAEEVLERLDPLFTNWAMIPVVTIDGREVQPTDLSFDLYVLQGFYIDDGSQYPTGEGFGVAAARIEREFDVYADAPSSFTQWVGFPIYGQSNARGYGYNTLFTTVASYAGRVLCFNGGPRADPLNPGSSMSSTKNLVEDILDLGIASSHGESPLSGLCYGFLENAFVETGIAINSRPVVLGHIPAIGGAAIDPLTDGTYYPRFTTSIDYMHTRAGGNTFSVACVVFDQGEANAGSTTQANYQTKLRTLYDQIVASVNSETSQTFPPIMLVKQLSWSAQPTALTGAGGANTYPAGVCLATAAEQGDGIFVAFPDYMMPFLDGIHRTAVGNVLAGRMYARAASRILVEKKDWRGLEVSHAWIRGTQCFIKFDVPVQPLTLDYINVGVTTQAGFKLSDGSGNLPLTSQSVLNGDTVVLELSRAVSGTPTLRYGLDYLPAGSGMHPESAGGNLRDSDTETFSISGTDYTLANWLLAFSITPQVMGTI